MRNKFNPLDYLEKEKSQPVQRQNLNTESTTATLSHPNATYLQRDFPPSQAEGSRPFEERESQLERLVTEIENHATDITYTEERWRNVAFALCAEFGEQGRQYFHRLSKFHPHYKYAESDKKYDHAMRRGQSGITISTLYNYLKEAGLSIRSPRLQPVFTSQSPGVTYQPPIQGQIENRGIKAEQEDGKEPPPFIPDSVFKNLPGILTKVVQEAESNQERDLLLLGALVTTSSLMFNVSGIYRRKKIYPSLFLFITGPASAGKGMLSFTKLLVNPYHRRLKEASEEAWLRYQKELAEYKASKIKETSDVPHEPPRKLLFIPANNSSAGFRKLLADNEGVGLLFETEADTLTNAVKSEVGNYSDMLRKAYEHEPISSYRSTKNEYNDIENPRLALLLSGTPAQISTLIPNVEDGFFSRFQFYSISIGELWKDLELENDEDCNLEDVFAELGERYCGFIEILHQQGEVRFKSTQYLVNRFNEEFPVMLKEANEKLGIDTTASGRRLGTFAFRVCMILTILRMMDTGKRLRVASPTDEDVDTSLEISKAIFEHTLQVFSQLKGALPMRAKDRKQMFYTALPRQFNRQQYLQVAAGININKKTAERYISQLKKEGLIKHEHNNYKKVI